MKKKLFHSQPLNKCIIFCLGGPTKPPPTPGKQEIGEVVPNVPAVVAAATAAKVAETAAAEAAAAAAAEAAAAAAAETAAVVAGETAAVVAGETAAIAGTAVLAETGILAGIEMFLPLLTFFGKRDISDETRAFEDLVQSVLKRQNVDWFLLDNGHLIK